MPVQQKIKLCFRTNLKKLMLLNDYNSIFLTNCIVAKIKAFLVNLVHSK